MSEWQHIATAPRERHGDEILVCQLYDDGSSTIKIAYWDEDLGLWNIGEPFMDEHEWTHWMPLAKPPSA